MASNIKLLNANGKTLEIVNSDTNLTDVTIDGGKILAQTDTIASLRAMVEKPSTVYVTGYTTANDNAFGSNFFKLSDTAWTGSLDNGGTIIETTNAVYELQYSGAVNVKWFGAVGDGITDDTTAFNKAILAFPQTTPFYDSGTIPMPKNIVIKLTSGKYLLTGSVDNINALVTYEAESDVSFINENFLSGRIDVQARHVNSTPTGIKENSSGFSTRALTNGYRATTKGLNDSGGTFGIATPAGLSKNGVGDSVALTVQNLAGTGVEKLTGTTYTATTVTYTNSVTSIKVGSILWIPEAGLAFEAGYISGIVDSINTETKTVTVLDGWWLFDGSAGTNKTPTNGIDTYIDIYDKIWGVNINTTIQPNTTKTSMAGIELGLLPSENANANADATVRPYSWGVDVVNLASSLFSSVAFMARKKFRIGFLSRGPSTGFKTVVDAGGVNTIGFHHAAEGLAAFRADDYITGLTNVHISTKGNVEFGSVGGSSLIFMDYKSVHADFDVRLQYSVGASSASASGLGTYTIYAGTVLTSAHLVPTVNAVRSLGTPTQRWGNIHGTEYYAQGLHGVTGTFASPTSITVTGGIITAIS